MKNFSRQPMAVSVSVSVSVSAPGPPSDLRSCPSFAAYALTYNRIRNNTKQYDLVRITTAKIRVM